MEARKQFPEFPSGDDIVTDQALIAVQLHGVTPDIVTLGKPIGNGFPMGAVVVSRPLSQSFANGMAYFATFGGCTAAGAAGTGIFPPSVI